MRLSALLLCAASLAAQGPETARAEEILARVDRLRHPWPAFTVELTVATAKASQRWRVAAREDGDARLDGLSDKERGRAVLLKGDDMWLLLPGTKRPLKVTPQQRLLGPAAGGDVARTRFREDYRVAGMAEEPFEGRPCWRLDLEARRPALSARTVRLWVARNDGAPLRAEFRLASGKLARAAEFDPPGMAAGRPVLRALTLTEPDGSKATLTFAGWHPGGVDPTWFEPPAER